MKTETRTNWRAEHLWSYYWEGYCIWPNLYEFRWSVVNYRPRIHPRAWLAFKDGIRAKAADLAKAMNT